MSAASTWPQRFHHVLRVHWSLFASSPACSSHASSSLCDWGMIIDAADILTLFIQTDSELASARSHQIPPLAGFCQLRRLEYSYNEVRNERVWMTRDTTSTPCHILKTNVYC